MNKYELKVEEKRARYVERACKAREESLDLSLRASELAEVLPFGQPILVGHHSEKRDRNYRARIGRTMGKSFAAQEKAEHYEQKAANVGAGGISSDDPDAVQKLRDDLVSAESSQERMKSINKVCRINKSPEAQTLALLNLGLTEAQASEVIAAAVPGRAVFAAFELTNNNARIARIKGRIAELEKRHQRTNVERKFDNFTYREDVEENRIMFIFAGKPAGSIRDILKRHAFKWSPSRNAWVRQLNANGLWGAREVLSELTGERHESKN